MSGREPPTDALSGPVASVICGFSAKKETQSSTTLRPLQAWNKAAESAGSPTAPRLGLGAHVGCWGVTGPAWRLPVCWDSPAECPWPPGPAPWGLSAERGWGARSPQPLRGLAEMSATKDGTQRGLSRNKGQVLVWAEGWGWAGQMFTWNGLSGHPQATGAAGAWHGAFLPTTMGHCKDSDPPQVGTDPKEPRGTASQGLGTATPSRALPAVRDRRSREGWLSLSFWKHLLARRPAGLPRPAGRLCAVKGTPPLQQEGLQSVQLGKELRPPRGCCPCSCLLARGTSVWCAPGTLK